MTIPDGKGSQRNEIGKKRSCWPHSCLFDTERSLVCSVPRRSTACARDDMGARSMRASRNCRVEMGLNAFLIQ